MVSIMKEISHSPKEERIMCINIENSLRTTHVSNCRLFSLKKFTRYHIEFYVILSTTVKLHMLFWTVCNANSKTNLQASNGGHQKKPKNSMNGYMIRKNNIEQVTELMLTPNALIASLILWSPYE